MALRDIINSLMTNPVGSMTVNTQDRLGAGRPHATTSAAIEAVAFDLFRSRGFEQTTVDDIAQAVGVSRRTLFRYFPSKNDIPWGQFDAGLANLRAFLDQMPPELPLLDAVHAAVMKFNRFDPAALRLHRERMTLLLTTPALQAHSVLRYEQWRRVIAEFVAARTGLDPDDQLPRTVGHVSLSLSLAAYEQWLIDPGADLNELLANNADLLRGYVAD